VTGDKEFDELIQAVRVQGRIEGVIAATQTLGGLIESGLIEDPAALIVLRKLRDGMSTVILMTDYDNLEKFRDA
jgi:hypothetical protein